MSRKRDSSGEIKSTNGVEDALEISLDDEEEENWNKEPANPFLLQEIDMKSLEHLVQSMQFVFGRDPTDSSFFKSFKPGGWYSDRVIDTWGNYLMKLYKPAGTYWVTSYWIKRQVSLLSSFNERNGPNKRAMSLLSSYNAVECNVSLFSYTLLSDNLWNSFQLSECKVLFIPVNKKNEHWILIVLCNLHNLKAILTKQEGYESLDKPFIFQMDSIHNADNSPLHCEEIVAKIIVATVWLKASKEIESTFNIAEIFNLMLPIIDVTVPQQSNGFDCGIFLLYYMEMVLMVAPNRASIDSQYATAMPPSCDLGPTREFHHKAFWEAYKRINQSVIPNRELSVKK